MVNPLLKEKEWFEKQQQTLSTDIQGQWETRGEEKKLKQLEREVAEELEVRNLLGLEGKYSR